MYKNITNIALIILVVLLGYFTWYSYTTSRNLLAQQEIRNTVSNFGLYVDEHRWDELQGLMTETVTIDYTSLFGGNQEKLKSSELVSRWKGFLPKFDATHHMITNLEVIMHDECHASVNSQVRATHYLANEEGEDFWITGGQYLHKLQDVDGAWKINSITYTLGYNEGDMAHLLQITSQ